MPRAARVKKEPEPEIDLRSSRSSRPSRRLVVVSTFTVLGIVVSAGSMAWGRSDGGQIDVSATIANSSYNAEVLESGEGNTVPTPISNTLAEMPNGGLTPQDPSLTPPPSPEPVSDPTASTTATSTDEGVQGEEAAPNDAASESENREGGDTETLTEVPEEAPADPAVVSE